MSLSQERKRHVPIIQVVTKLLTVALAQQGAAAAQLEGALFRHVVFDALPQDAQLRTSMRGPVVA